MQICIKQFLWLTGFGLFVPSAFACNNLRFTFPQTTWSFNTNPAPALQIRVQRSGVAFGCQWFVAATTGGAPDYASRRLITSGGDTMQLLLRDNTMTEIVKDVPDAVSNADVIEGSFPAGSGPTQINVNYRPTRESPITYKRFGTYSETITWRIYEGPIGGPYTLRRSQNVTYTQTVPKVIDLSLVDTGGPLNIADTAQTLNFGTLTTGAQQGFDVLLAYNAGYLLKLSSTNNGNLRKTLASDLLPYTLKVNSVPINLAGSQAVPVTVSSAVGVSPSNGLRFPVEVTVGNVNLVTSGIYSDVIALTVQSIE